MPACVSGTTPHLGPKNKTKARTKSLSESQSPHQLLQNCANFRQLRQIHAKIIRAGLSGDQLLLRKLLSLCSSYGEMDYATRLFHHSIPVAGGPHHTFTWNLMIRAYTSNARSHQALLLFKLMISRGIPPDKFTFPFVIRACLTSSAFRLGEVVHGLAIRTSFSADIFLQNNLMDFYFKSGHASSGRRLFDKMRVRSVVSWTTMLTGLLNCGDLHTARSIFDQMPTKNVVSWTAMIDGYVRNQQPDEAFQLFRRMQLDNVWPNEFTLVSLLKACAQLGSLKLGRRIHDFALKNGFKLEAVFVGTALIDMYSKCGSLADARRVFDQMEIKSLATWNAMITGLGVYGFGEEALALFQEMEKMNVQPDEITFVGVLCACLQTNNLSDGCKYFEHMTKRYGIAPIPEHYSCMIELYDRVGMLDEVGRLVNTMPTKPNHNKVRGTNTHATANIGKHAEDLNCL
ncbi:Tetratricopeptide-like helical domain containing protein [Trema orientale]|uniref:Tetratricopeptide-like helical domain containing protein n=1 Tax=Trema orientale TaxID=63057 RepID=A0A2P5BNY3_TREOI|nr:Tetratricopeptide-like helical domain containing protein [Trema orientale]